MLSKEKLAAMKYLKNEYTKMFYISNNIKK